MLVVIDKKAVLRDRDSGAEFVVFVFCVWWDGC